MRLPKVNNFLGCMTIHTGAAIIGWLCLINSIFVLISLTTYAAEFSQISEAQQESMIERLGNYPQNDTTDKEDIKTVVYYVQVIFWFIFAIGICKFLIDLFLVIGVHKKNHYLMLPWLIMQGLGCILLFTALIIWSVLILMFLVQILSNGGDDHQFFRAIAITLGLIINSVLASYCFLIVHTCYTNFKNHLKQSAMVYVKM
uniref:Putative membrane protein n=1 Tax=Panstrongylus megistus TaxID=65343 RepID=A0A069DQF5_9HEMI